MDRAHIRYIQDIYITYYIYIYIQDTHIYIHIYGVCSILEYSNNQFVYIWIMTSTSSNTLPPDHMSHSLNIITSGCNKNS